jgi:hypothetical protein
MTDGTEGTTTAPFPEAPMARETGEGSLLKIAIAAAEERTRSKLMLARGVQNAVEDVAVELSPNGGVSIIDADAFDSYRDKPLFVSGTAQLGDLASLILYANRHKDSDSVVFASDDRKAPAITAVLDYAKQGGPADGGQRFGRHQATHLLPLSDEWKAWADLNGETITMPNFARFLEDHIIDVLPPGMIELSEAQEQVRHGARRPRSHRGSGEADGAGDRAFASMRIRRSASHEPAIGRG